MDREEVTGLVGHKVAVRLNSIEARGVEIVATLEEVRGDGIILSNMGELGQGPMLFCPWESLHRVRERPPWLAPPHEETEAEQWESYELREATEEEVASEPLPKRREPSARTLERVVSVAQNKTVDGITFAISSLELYGEGLGVLRWRISFGEEALRRDPDLGFGMPEPEFEIQDVSGRTLPWSPRGRATATVRGTGKARSETCRRPEN